MGKLIFKPYLPLETDNSNNTEYIEREKQVIELSKQNKSTRYIAETLKMSLRDIGIILKKHGLSHGIALIKDSNKSSNEKSTYNHGNNNTAAAKLYQKYYNDYREGILEMAKGFLNILTNQLANKTMVAAVEG